MGRILVICWVLGCGGGDTNVPGGDCSEPAPEASGEATYYDADGTGNCSFAASPNDLLVAAMNAADYNTAAWCGACVAVTGPDGSVVVRVVDQCPGCAHGDLDLSREAFAMIAPLAAGRVPITWHEVACDVSGPIEYHFKDGANAYWTAIQVRNHRYPIATFEAQDGASWRLIERLSYNYFVESAGLGTGPYGLRVTDTRGHVLEDVAVALGDNVTRTGAAQFPACP
ncbi:MAG TPA: expansin EXLX1 family cellulose-binding protein [Kofleriaceae bacterium]